MPASLFLIWKPCVINIGDAELESPIRRCRSAWQLHCHTPHISKDLGRWLCVPPFRAVCLCLAVKWNINGGCFKSLAYICSFTKYFIGNRDQKLQYFSGFFEEKCSERRSSARAIKAMTMAHKCGVITANENHLFRSNRPGM
jgi:hypothetical protein